MDVWMKRVSALHFDGQEGKREGGGAVVRVQLTLIIAYCTTIYFT